MMYALISHEDMALGPGAAPLDSATAAPVKAGGGGGGAGEGVAADREVAFVFTDIESSTELSQQDPEAFKQVRAEFMACAMCTHAMV
jgi:class 3 adenylate cyclase